MATPIQVHRQVDPPTTSIDYWWPFPATDTSIKTSTTWDTAAPTLLAPTLTSALLSSVTDISSSTSISLISSASLTTTLSASSATPSSSAISSYSSSSLILISALPPDPSGSLAHSLPKLDIAADSRTIYILAPILAVAGIIFGAGGACLWFRIRRERSSGSSSPGDGDSPSSRRTRNRLARRHFQTTFASGPVYASLSPHVDDGYGDSKAIDGSDKLYDIDEELHIPSEDIVDSSGQNGSPSKRTFPKHGSVYHPSSIRGAFQASKIFSVPSLIGRHEHNGPTSPDLEASPLLHDTGFEKRPPSLHARSLRTQAESIIFDNDDVFSPMSNYGSKPTAAYLSPANHAILFKPQIGNSSLTTCHDDLGIHHGSGSASSAEPRGFRIIEEEPSPRLFTRSKLGDSKGRGSHSLPRRPDIVTPKKNSSWRLFLPPPLGSSNEEDKFTALPTSIPRRRDPKHANTETSVMSRQNIPLPKSPPQITSPPLESQLFFTSPSQSTTNVPPPFKRVGLSSASPSQNQDVPPRVPSKSDYRLKLKERRLTESSSQQVMGARSQGCKQRHIETNMGDSNKRTPRQRYEARAKALDRVEEIVSRSYSQQLDKAQAKC